MKQARRLSSAATGALLRPIRSMARITTIFVKRLQSVAGLVISDHTVDISWSSRGDEIRKYLEDHPEITGYVILDDIPFTSFDACNLGDHLILTSERRGLTQKDADEAIRKLNGDMQAT